MQYDILFLFAMNEALAFNDLTKRRITDNNIILSRIFAHRHK